MGPSGTPTRLLFQDAGAGGSEIPDSALVFPGTAILVRAIPIDGSGHTFANLTEDWSVTGGGALDAAVTSPTGGNDPTLNRWTTAASPGVQAVTVTLQAYPGVISVLHVRALSLVMDRVNPDPAPDLTLGLGQVVALTVRLTTSTGQPFNLPIRFSAGISPWYGCGQAHPTADLGSFAPAGGGPSSPTLTVTPDAQGLAHAVYTAPTRLSVQGLPPGSGCVFGVGASAIVSLVGVTQSIPGTSWELHQSAGPPAGIVAIAGDGQAASPGAMLAIPLQVEVDDAYGNAVPGIAVTWTVTAGGGSLGTGMTTTNASGRTSVVWTVGPASGTQTVSASIAGGITVGFSASVS